MAVTLNQIQPAPAQEVNTYISYYRGNKRNLLPLAVSLYQNGVFEGHRVIEGGENIPFIASWGTSKLPTDLTHCHIQFERNVELSYEIVMTNHELIGFLIEVITIFRHSNLADFPKSFYRKLLRWDELSSVNL